MIRLPYYLRNPEGIRYPKIGYFWYKSDCFWENLFIKKVSMPEYGLYRGKPRKEKFIISLTTYPGRINEVFYAIKSMMIQSVQADKIILWLAEEQFPDKKLPDNIHLLEDLGLTIRWCDDLRSHKKYFYALQEQKPDELVATYDDDIIYEYDSIEKLLTYHNKFPNAIICNRGYEITLDNKGKMKPYNEWKMYTDYGIKEPGIRIMPSNGGGCLWPYGCMPKIAFNWNLIKENSYTQDDLWMRFCTLNNGIKAIKTRKKHATVCMVNNTQAESLTSINNIQGENINVQKKLMKLFPDIILQD